MKTHCPSILALSAFALTSFPLRAQDPFGAVEAPSVAASSPQPKLKTFDLEFPGGPPQLLVDAISKAL
jgi:hypothetical protein